MTGDKQQIQMIQRALYLDWLVRVFNISWRERVKIFKGGNLLLLSEEEWEEYLALAFPNKRGERPLPLKHFSDQALYLYEDDLRISCPANATWPNNLSFIPDPPLWLWYKGQAPSILNNTIPIAVVGARKLIPYSRYLCKNIISLLVANRHPIVSGLALGLDSEAHCTTLARGGVTCALLPCGLEGVYPKTNRRLAEEIQKEGFIASEFPPEYPIRKINFHSRNRLISGLSHAVIIIQAAEKSGTLITARFAAEQGREVLVAPAHLELESYRGSLQLIADGAMILDSLARLNDFREAKSCTPELSERTRQKPAEDGGEMKKGEMVCLDKRSDEYDSLAQKERELILKIGVNSYSEEELLHIAEISFSKLSACLLKLERKGYICREVGRVFLTEAALCCIY